VFAEAVKAYGYVRHADGTWGREDEEDESSGRLLRQFALILLNDLQL
jgi:hypothetical protein